MPTVEQAVDEFLSQKRIAVAGVSRNPGGAHASNGIYSRLKERGYEVFPVNPNADKVLGDGATTASRTSRAGSMASSSPRIRSVSLSVAKECQELGIRRVWFHKNIGTGSYSREAHDFCRANGITAARELPALVRQDLGRFPPLLRLPPAGCSDRCPGRSETRAVTAMAEGRPSDLRIVIARMRRTPWRRALRQASALAEDEGVGAASRTPRRRGLRSPRGRCPRRALRVPAARAHRAGGVAWSRHLRPAARHLERRRRPHAGAPRLAALRGVRHGRPGPPRPGAGATRASTRREGRSSTSGMPPRGR